MPFKIKTTERFILEGNNYHNGKYDYSLVVYVNSKTKVKIICPIHGEFEQTPTNHLRSGCIRCSNGESKKHPINNKKIIDRLTIEEEPIEIDGEIQCRCAYCKQYFVPTRKQLRSRTRVLADNNRGESRLYCSDGCKKQCPIFHKSKYNNLFQFDTSRPDQSELRQLTLTRDNFECQRCGSSEDLHCHHITGVEINPVESADLDNCITLCKDCHQKAHKEKGCNMRRQLCENKEREGHAIYRCIQ
jgi:5-methylcytosine-specific restriction endonuclease McrA